MKNKVFVLLILFGCALATACRAGTQQGNIELHYYKEGYQDLCYEILKRNKTDTLKGIQVGFYPENAHKSFFADIDNDGKDEEFKYYEAANHTYLWEIVDGERKAPLNPLARTVFYSGAQIIKTNNDFFLMHMFHEDINHRGPLEIQHFTRITEKEAWREIPPEMRKLTFNTLRYKVDLVCKYYED